ncbi:MAG: ABC transporter permease, partial [Planctomycetota bacterium]
MYKYFLGLKYLLGRPINLLGIFGVAVAVWALIVVISVFSGFIRGVRAQIRGPAPDLSLLIPGMGGSYDELIAKLGLDPAKDEDIVAAAPRLVWYGLLYPKGALAKWRPHYSQTSSSQVNSNFFQLIGIDFAKECEVTDLREWIDLGESEPLELDDPGRPFGPSLDSAVPAGKGMLMGSSRADRMAILPGAAITLSSARPLDDGDVQVVKRDFALSGAFRSISEEFDYSSALVEIWELRSIFGEDIEEDGEDIFNEVSIRLSDYTRADLVATRLNERLDSLGMRGRVYTWEERQVRFLTAVDVERGMMKLVLIVLMVVATFLIFATLSMMVTEKTRDVGILSSLGATRRGILAIFLFCGLAISTIGTAIGTVLGLLSLFYLNPVN